MVRRARAFARLAISLVVVIIVGVVGVPSPAQAAPAGRAGSAPTAATGVGNRLAPGIVAHPNYAGGVATAGIPGYDVPTWSKTYTCVFLDWAHVQVNWQCRLKDPVSGGYLQTHSGSFTNGSATTPTYYYHTADAYLCTVASAGYADGSASDSDTRCN